jgi:two-component system phosphate regulon response regulator PhoB
VCIPLGNEMRTQAGITRLRTHRPSNPREQRAERDAPVLFVVDDDVATVDLLCEVAREHGWEARGFTRLEPLQSALRSRTPTLLILDDELPDGRGGDLARQLSRDASTADIPLLVCTAAHPIRQAEIGAWAPVVAKPFDLDEVERFLIAASRRREGGSRLGQAG